MLNVSVYGAPTGMVLNGGSASFRVGPSDAGAPFIFATEGGTIAGWNPSLGTAAEVKVDSSAAGAIYKGLAIATTATGPQLFATDFHNAASMSSTRRGRPSRPQAASSIQRFPQ